VPDWVIANAGISAGTDTGAPGDAEVFEQIMRTNVVGMFDTFAPFAPAMRAAGSGRLVGIASVAGVRGLPGAGAYSASKAAAIAYLESLRVELRGSGVRVVTLAPGFIRTPMTAANRYAMPFLTDADVFAARALDLIAAGRSFAVIPWQMAWVARVLRVLPDALFDRVFARAPRKSRREA
jgi:short-subunit dehydrogenase